MATSASVSMAPVRSALPAQNVTDEAEEVSADSAPFATLLAPAPIPEPEAPPAFETELDLNEAETEKDPDPLGYVPGMHDSLGMDQSIDPELSTSKPSEVPQTSKHGLESDQGDRFHASQQGNVLGAQEERPLTDNMEPLEARPEPVVRGFEGDLLPISSEAPIIDNENLQAAEHSIVELSTPQTPHVANEAIDLARHSPTMASTGMTQVTQTVLDTVHSENLHLGSNQEIIVHLQPKELGTVTVSLRMDEDGCIRGVLSAANTSTLAALQQNIHDLVTGLNESGLNVDPQGFSFNDGSFHREGESGPFGHDAEAFTHLENQPAPKSSSAHDNRNYTTQPYGLISVHI